MSSFSRQQLELYLKTIKVKGGKVLDVGGSQNPITNRLRVFEPDEYKILDLEQPHECRQKPDIVCDLNKISFKDGYENYFDVIFCIEVSEYWYNPFKAVNIINEYLKKNGILYISFHQQYPCHNPVEQDYLRYTPQGAKKILEETGFEIIKEIPRLMNNEGIYNAFITTEKMRPAKNYNKHSWIGVIIEAKKL